MALGVPALLVAVLLGLGALQSETRPIYAYVGLAILASFTVLTLRYRLRNASLWFLLLVGILNFTPALFRPVALEAEPPLAKLVKDVPVLILLAVSLLVGRRAPRPELLNPQLRLFKALLFGWAIVIAANVLITHPALPGLLVSVRYYVVYPLLTVAIANLDLEEREIQVLIRGLIILSAVEALLAAGEFLGLFGGTYYANYVSIGGKSYPRAIGTFGNPNNLGLFLGLPLLLLIASMSKSTRPEDRLFPPFMTFVFTGTILLGLALTFSKTAPLALVIALVGLSRRLDKRRGLMLALLFTGGMLFLVAEGRVKSGGLAEGELGSRLVTVPSAYRQWVRSPKAFVFGDGIGSTSSLVNNAVSSTVTDNMPLTLAQEGGVVGLVIFSLVCAAALRVAVLGFRVSEQHKTKVGGLLAYAVFFLVYAAVSVNFRLFPGAMFFWISIGLAVQLATHALPETSRRLSV
jgi:hypothetical protein